MFNKNVLFTENLEFEDEVKECAEWLKHNIAPWADVLEKWQKTYNIRMNDLATLEERNLANIFDNWSLFKHPQGYELINIDFNKMNITNMEINFNIWKKFFEAIREMQTTSSKDSNVFLMLKEIDNEDVTEDNKVVKMIHLLSHFVPPRKLCGRGKKIFKPSIAIAQQSMIKHVNVSICLKIIFLLYT